MNWSAKAIRTICKSVQVQADHAPCFNSNATSTGLLPITRQHAHSAFRNIKAPAAKGPFSGACFGYITNIANLRYRTDEIWLPPVYMHKGKAGRDPHMDCSKFLYSPSTPRSTPTLFAAATTQHYSTHCIIRRLRHCPGSPLALHAAPSVLTAC